MTNGYLKQLRVDIGSFVQAGEVLALLENPELHNEMQAVEAQYLERKKLFSKFREHPLSTPTGTDMEGKKAIYVRLKAIYEKTPQLTTLADVDKAKADYETAKASLETETDRLEAESTKLSAQLRSLRQQLDYLTVRAPFSGVIVSRYADKGAVIQSGLNNPNAMPLFDIQDLQPVRLAIDVAETDAVLLQKDSKVKVNFPDLPNVSLSASVSRIAYGLNETSRTMKVEIDIPNKELKIRSGMYAQVEIASGGHAQAMAVPNEALANAKGQSFIYVVEKGRVKKLVIKTGVRDEKYTEILNGEVKPSDAVVIRGKEFCSDGAAVQARSLTE
jgi:RND family efflux transporter MFP subunit